MILFLSATTLQAQSRAIRPVNIQIPNEGEVQLYEGSYALVIGVSDYQDNAWVDLDSVGADVKAVRETLEEQGFAVETLMNPTKNRLLNGITDFIDTHGYEQENRLLFYYSGHGHTQERNGRKFGYLVPVDAPNPFENEKVFYRKSLKMEQVISWSKQIESKHALFVFDSCFSGSVLQSRAITVPEDISYLTAKPVRQFISAGSANQTVPSESVFRPLFIRGINGKADLDKDGYVTGVELGMYLQKQVPRYQTGQTPQYGKILDPYLDEGNFVFEVGNRRRPPTTKIEPIKKSKIVTLYIKDVDWGSNWFNPAFWKTSKNLESDHVYVGEVSNWVPNGQGTFTFADGNKYVGAFKDGLFNGQGTFTWSDGRKYVGEVKDNKWHGQGTHTWPAGEKYVGEYKDDKMHGQGTFTWSNGAKYVGEWKDNNQNGQGTFTWSKGEFAGQKYVGEYKDDKRHGQGTFTWASGKKYVGEFKDGNKHGQGTFTWADGRKYVGEVKDNKKHGQGTYIWPDGTKYVGAFRDGLSHGQGTHTWPNGKKYVGAWKDGKKHGQGAITYSSGAKYVGEYKDDKRNGHGTWTWPDGAKYVGEYKDDKRNGHGTFTHPDGRVVSGLWRDNEFLGSK